MIVCQCGNRKQERPDGNSFPAPNLIHFNELKLYDVPDSIEVCAESQI